MKDQLIKQMEEKNKIKLEAREISKKFYGEILKDAENYKSEQAAKLNQEQNKNKNYKKDLDKQLQDKKINFK